MKRGVTMKKYFSCLLTAAMMASLLILPSHAAEFSDVPEDHWAHDAVVYVADKGLFAGTGNGTFSPDAEMTRAMLIQVLFRYAGSPQLPDTWVFPYQDVPDDAYYWDAAFWGRHRNILADEFVENCDTLRPDEPVTRVEFAEMLWKFAREEFGYEAVQGDETVMENSPFTDMDLGDPGVTITVRRAMLGWAYPNGILSGTGAGTMSPDALVTRAQVATMLRQYDQKFHADDSSEEDGVGAQGPGYRLQLGVMKTTLEVGEKTQALALTIPSSSNMTYTITSSNPSVLSAQTNTDSGSGATLTGIRAGTATLSVTDANGVTDTVAITVTDAAASDPSSQGGEESSSNGLSEQERQELTQRMVELVNEERAKAGLPALKTNDQIAQVAQTRAAELADSYSHTRPDGRSCFTALEDAGIRYGSAGENIAYGGSSPEYILASWMDSPGHRANILNENFTTIGVGCYLERNGMISGYDWVQVFTN